MKELKTSLNNLINGDGTELDHETSLELFHHPQPRSSQILKTSNSPDAANGDTATNTQTKSPACVNCKRQRKGCDREQTCARCERSNIICIYNEIAMPRKIRKISKPFIPTPASLNENLKLIKEVKGTSIRSQQKFNYLPELIQPFTVKSFIDDLTNLGKIILEPKLKPKPQPTQKNGEARKVSKNDQNNSDVDKQHQSCNFEKEGGMVDGPSKEIELIAGGSSSQNEQVNKPRDKEIQINAYANREIEVSNFEFNSLYLSKLLLALSINLIVAEILIKFNTIKTQPWLKSRHGRAIEVAQFTYPDDLDRNFKDFKARCLHKCCLIYSHIDINSVTPSIIPDAYYGPNRDNSHDINYNLALGSLHLANYYHILNLTNSFNNPSMEVSLSSIKEGSENFGNERQANEKIKYLSKAITYFQLIKKKGTDEQLSSKLSELYEQIYSFERYYLLFSYYDYNLNRFRNNDIIVHLHVKQYYTESITNYKNNDYVVLLKKLFHLFCILEDQDEFDYERISNGYIDLSKFTSFNVELNETKTKNFANDEYSRIKTKIQDSIARYGSGDDGHDNSQIFEIIRNLVLFKILLIYPPNDVRLELDQLIKNLNENLEASKSIVFNLKISNFQLLPSLLQVLKIAYKFKKHMAKDFDAFTIHLTNLTFFVNNIENLIASDKDLKSCFEGIQVRTRKRVRENETNG